MQSLDSCEYIWEAGVGFAQSPPLNYLHDLNRWACDQMYFYFQRRVFLSCFLGNLLISNHHTRPIQRDYLKSRHLRLLGCNQTRLFAFFSYLCRMFLRQNDVYGMFIARNSEWTVSIKVCVWVCRTELLRLLLTCFSEAMYLPPSSDGNIINPWVTFFCSTENRWVVQPTIR